MKIVKADSVKQLSDVEKLYLEAFPKAERKPFAMIKKLNKKGKSEMLCLESDNGDFLGLAITVLYEDLVLLDYEMPIVDGKQVLGMIRAEKEFSDMPVIFLTSKDDKESVMQVMSLKPDGYLLKTLEPAKIIQAVDDFFEKQKGKMHA